MAMIIQPTRDFPCHVSPMHYCHEPLHWAHRAIQWIDGYFHLREHDSQPLWLTILKIASYSTLIFPVILFCAKGVLRAIYSSPKETMNSDAIALQDTVFMHPKLLMKHSIHLASVGADVNFIEVKLNGRLQIAAVLSMPNQGEYVRCKTAASQILLELVSHIDIAPCLQPLFDHSPQGDFPTDFFAVLLTPDQQGRIPLCTAVKDSKILLQILHYAKKNHVDVDPQIIDDLLVSWVGEGNAELTKTLLLLHPEGIYEKIDGHSLLYKALLAGSQKEIPLLLQAMQNQNIVLSPMDAWLYKAYANDCTFTKEEFHLLSAQEQHLVLQIANQYLRPEFLFKLREIAEKEEPQRPKKADLFSFNMDGIDVAITLDQFLKDARKEGLLLTEQEFAPLRDQYEAPRFVNSLNSSSFLSQKMFRTEAARLQLSFVKTQKNIAVIPKDISHLKMCLNKLPDMAIDCPEVFVFSEKITPIERYLTREEMDDLLDLIECLGYRFLLKETHLLLGKNSDGEEGLYFIGNVHRPFGAHAEYDRMHLLAHLMAPQDHAWLNRKIDVRKKHFDLLMPEIQEEQALVNRQKAFEHHEALVHGFGIERYLQVPIAHIVKSNPGNPP